MEPSSSFADANGRADGPIVGKQAAPTIIKLAARKPQASRPARPQRNWAAKVNNERKHNINNNANEGDGDDDHHLVCGLLLLLLLLSLSLSLSRSLAIVSS